MENFGTIRRLANALRLKFDPDLSELDASAVVASAMKACDLAYEELEPEDASLAGALGVLNRQFNLVLVSKALPPAEKAEVVAHEIGHFIVHDAPQATVSGTYDTPGLGDPVQRVEAYGVKERREAQANAFARELLLPRTLARRMFRNGSRAQAMAAKLGLRRETVFQQLTDALLLPEVPPAEPRPPSPPRPLDSSQQTAANHRGEAFLLEAGPGTGKTRTLVDRISDLLTRGDAQADEILALTFSNKAAGEIADRVSAKVGAGAANIWTGTFHAFGLELLRKYHDVFGKGEDPRLIDGSEAINLMEDTLPVLPIVHLQNLFEPALALRDIFRAISRAKDELVGPDSYAMLAANMATAARITGLEEDRLEAAKASEVSLVYKAYQAKLVELGAVDYGDLVMLPALKLQDDADFAAVLRTRFKWVHVDEYQDINHASAMLVKGIVGDGTNLWVVGDARQSIYRFRGASTANMARFGVWYPQSKRDQLKVNYRSSERIVETFRAFGNDMSVSSYALPLALTADRRETGTPPSCLAASDADIEMDHLAGAIRALERDGVALRDQAVLARSNGALARISENLEARGLPVLYLGPLFERAEVRDLLSLLSLVAGSSSTLLRVGRLGEYDAPLADILTLTADARANDTRVLDRLRQLESVQGLSERGRRALGLLAQHLAGFHAGNTPWLVLMEYLFERSDYLVALLQGQAPRDDMRRVAVRQLIEAMRSMPLHGHRSPITRGLNRVRHMVLLADDRDLRRLPDELAHLDGVQLLTVHASKGLEFEAVHLPGLRAGALPAANRADRCPPPTGLIKDPAESDGHLAEEECLFFVALSRARSHLRLYRPTSNNGRNANPSAFLSRPGLALPSPTTPETIVRTLHPPAPTPLLEPEPPVMLSAKNLERYERCPRRFYYEQVARLRGDGAASVYLSAHQCLMAVIETARLSSAPLSPDQMAAAFEQAWAASDMVGHIFEQPYRRLVETMLTNLEPVLASGELKHGVDLALDIRGIAVRLDVDQVLAGPRGAIYRTIKGGKLSKTEADRLGNALLLEAVAAQAGPTGRVETFHLVDGATTVVTQTDAKKRNRLASSASFVEAIARGDYPPNPSDWECPRCRYFFLCPAPLDADI